jgi:hypothetical protein
LRRFRSIIFKGPAGLIIEGAVETEAPDAIHPNALPQLEKGKFACLKVWRRAARRFRNRKRSRLSRTKGVMSTR